YTYRRAYGPECGIWRSIDHGTTWTLLSAGLPAPSDNVSRIALGIAKSRPSTIYAQIVSQSGGSYNGLGMFRSLDGGDTWARRDAGTFTGNFGGFGWYFGDMAVDPTNPDRIYTLGVDLYTSGDGGVSYSLITPGHVDQHALWIDPANPQRLFAGCDGGFFSTTTGGPPWTKSLDLPITQFYAGTIDPTNPLRVMGGAQDNGTVITTGSRTGWTSVLGGDGFQCIIDPVNPALIFSEWQNCCDRSGPRRGGAAPAGFSSADRYGWMTPIAMDPGNHNVLLVGSQRVYRSTDNGVSYTPISGDLTTNPVSSLGFGTVSTLAASPLASGAYYAGTDDGRIWRTPDGGATWIEITSGLPVRSVTRVVPDPFVLGVVYVTLSGFGQDEHLAHVYRSSDDGATWTSISGNLPDAPANDLIVDPADPNTIFLATDVGVYITRNLGAGWEALGTGMPVQSVLDLTFHAPSRTLVAATHGRSQWKLDLSSWPTAAPPPIPAARLALAPPAPNPSRGTVSMALDPGGASRLRVEVYDAAGRLVRTLLAGPAGGSRVMLAWDGLDERGHRAGAGVYFVRAQAGGSTSIQRLVRLD
ncbi:MAG TPA: FlgD immunoglobulin-like domain containing protein, partial [Candidatus Eisenbacteria bacterium]